MLTGRIHMRSAGYGAHILHRTGHSLGEQVHGNGTHLDDSEIADFGREQQRVPRR